jgi:ABC-type multidrug transport system fused ATPase/permease subunit
MQTTWLSLWLQRDNPDMFHKSLYSMIAPALNHEWLGPSIYFGLGVVTLLAIYYQYTIWLLRSIHAGKVLHHEALQQVLDSPISFFDANPVGRILNRFSSDVETLETELCWSLQESISALLEALAALLLIVIVLPSLLLAAPPLYYIFHRLQKLFRIRSRDLRRLYSISRSPRFAHFKESLQGVATIRAFHRQHPFWERFFDTLTDYQRTFYNVVISSRWFTVRLSLLSTVISILVMIGIILLAQNHLITPAIAGLLIVYSLGFWVNLNWAVRSFAIAESNMTAAERIIHYCDLEAEKPYRLSPPLPEHTPWPVQGTIEFDKVSIRYAPHLPPVVSDVSFFIPHGTKVGVVGKTGSGKTTLVKALFRFIEPYSGEIKIDGINIAKVPLKRLRESLAIIPQDPVLFAGTLRDNLDRFDQYSDAQINAILTQIRLFEVLHKAAGDLNLPITHQGDNLSQGERQLVCLARALLSSAKIVILDEPTSSIDVKTDFIIQKAIRELCSNKTIIIIAHRLSTIHDCQLIINLDHAPSS